MIKYIGKCLLVKTNKEKILVVGDLHLGYEEALNQTGIFISRKMFEETIEELKLILKSAGKIQRVVLLGDVKHVFGTVVRQEWNDILSLIDFLFEYGVKKITIVKGNHDMILQPIINKRKNVELKDFYIDGGFAFMHGDKSFDELDDKKIKFWVMGHIHPAITLRDDIKSEKYKCFLIGNYENKEIIIVPSFISSNEGTDPREYSMNLPWNFDLDNFEVKIVSSSLEVLDFGKLKEMT